MEAVAVTDTPIEPALDPDEWASLEMVTRDVYARVSRTAPGWVEFDQNTEGSAVDAFPAAGMIALANAALPPDDPRKITREMVDAIRGLADFRRKVFLSDRPGSEEEAADMVESEMRFAAALESYLPPE